MDKELDKELEEWWRELNTYGLNDEVEPRVKRLKSRQTPLISQCAPGGWDEWRDYAAAANTATNRQSRPVDPPAFASDEIQTVSTIGTHYAALEIDTDASTEMIRAAFKRMAKRHHPDVGGDPARFQALVLAAEILSDQKRRAAYDATMLKKSRSVS